MKKLSSFTWNAGTLVMAAVIAAAPMSFAQFQGTPQPKHYPWSDTTLSPDARADMVVKELTLEEKISLLHGQGSAFSSAGPTESNGGAGYSVGIPRLGIPAIQMADSAYGVTRGAVSGRYSTALPNNLAAASSWDPQSAFEYGALIGRELRQEGYSMSLTALWTTCFWRSFLFCEKVGFATHLQDVRGPLQQRSNPVALVYTHKIIFGSPPGGVGQRAGRPQ